MSQRITLERIREAETVIDPVFLRSRQFVSESLSRLLGCTVILKVETANLIGCFKGRGAEYLAAKLPSGQPVVTASAGNFGQAMAYACRRREISLTVYAGINANPLKVERMRKLGADVRLFGSDFDEAKQEARRVADATQAKMVEDSRDIETVEGAGTIGLELTRFPAKIDAVVAPLGNGALCCGVGFCFKSLTPSTQIVAVQSEGAPAMIESWKQGKVVTYAATSTIADGIAVRIPVPEILEDMRGVIDHGILVEDRTLIEAMRIAHRHLGIILEPSGAAGLAALMENKAAYTGKCIAIILTGGNLTPDQIKNWLGSNP